MPIFIDELMKGLANFHSQSDVINLLRKEPIHKLKEHFGDEIIITGIHGKTPVV